MMQRIVPLNNLEYTVTSPIINTIIDDIKSFIIKNDEVEVMINTIYDNEDVSYSDRVNDNSFRKDILFVDYTIEDDEDYTGFNLFSNNSNHAIMRDGSIDLVLKPVFRHKLFNIKFTYLSKSKTSIDLLKRNYKMFFNTSNFKTNHNLTYSFILPKNLLALINKLKVMKGIDTTLWEYLTDVSVNILDRAVSVDHEVSTPVYRGGISNAIGRLETHPSGMVVNKHADKRSYTTQFELTMDVDFPEYLTVKYPIVVNNVPIPEIWLDEETVIETRRPMSNMFDLTILKDRLNEALTDDDILFKIPSYDKFSPSKPNCNFYKRLLSLQLEVTDVDNKKLFNLNDLTYIGLPDFLVHYFKNRKDSLTSVNNEIFFFELYENNEIRDAEVYIDDDFNLYTAIELDITSNFHLLINYTNKLSLLPYGNILNKEFMNDLDSMFKDMPITDLIEIDDDNVKLYTAVKLLTTLGIQHHFDKHITVINKTVTNQ